MLRVKSRMKTARTFFPTTLAFLFALSPVHSPAADLSRQSEPAAGARVTKDFDAGWLFSRGDFAAAMMPAFDDGNWRTLNVPHDWSSEGPFSAEYGSGNGYAPGGIGWYRKHFRLDAAQKYKLVAIEFDGVYDHSEVWINGQFVGARPFGFSSFQYDLTPYLKFNSDDNVVAVRVDHSRFADSRYYTGSGIYRNVRLSITDKLHVAQWGVFVATPKISTNGATVRIATKVTNESDSPREISVLATVYGPPGSAPDGSYACAEESPAVSVPAGKSMAVSLDVKMPWQPRLWDVEHPDLHTARVRILSSKQTVDEEVVAFGIREFHFDADKGFFLNGKNLKLKGVCIHHDAGSLGAAVPDKVLERRLRLLKEIGVNAIRTSHNPPDPELLNLCDRLGFLVMDEAFDEFTPSKNKWVTGRNNGVPSRFGYGDMFAQWSVTDAQDLVRRDRNHPSIILWSIGNEIDFANDPFSDPVLGENYHPENPSAKNLVTCAQPLVAAVKALDRTRPVTAALATVAMSDAVGLPQVLDVVGYNYQEARYADDHRKFPQRIIYGSENSHQYAAWLAVQTNNFISGQFLWTGIDYLGEANAWPHRASGAGLLDLCGFKKPLAWFRQSFWSDKPMVYICVSGGGGFGGGGGRRGFGGVESWNWQSNSTVTVLCYANCPEVTLTLNDKIIGTKKLSEAVNGALRWQLPFEPGTLKAVGRANGQDACDYTLKTAGAASRIELLPDTTQLRADGKDVCHVEFRIVDENGVRVSNADADVKFEMTGPASIIGIGNGDVNSVEDCKTNSHHAFQGRGLAILQTTTTSGSITMKATAPGLKSASVTLQSQ